MTIEIQNPRFVHPIVAKHTLAVDRFLTDNALKERLTFDDIRAGFSDSDARELNDGILSEIMRSLGVTPT